MPIETVSGTVTLQEFYVYDGSNLLLVLDGSGNVKNRYFKGPNENQVLAEETNIVSNGRSTDQAKMWTTGGAIQFGTFLLLGTMGKSAAVEGLEEETIGGPIAKLSGELDEAANTAPNQVNLLPNDPPPGDVPAAAEGATHRSPTDILMPGGQQVGTAGASSGIRRMNGGLPAAQSTFDELASGGKDITPPGYPGKLVELPNGGRVGLRAVSSSDDKSPSIDVKYPRYPGKEDSLCTVIRKSPCHFQMQW